ncbi:Gaa1-like protein [Lipomyces tetrasporus]|uniref:Gaa1-like protein n=1 Tax=Lipomyces tetrasporus TaxID=54092 RepID=A0AAD7QKT6_9ASCO|nr:Gaa1-like protein [Lipomyces tetrasporus]KAJ8097107.1 Gaa1-like protein [Lipomyces tetrasporus]
MAILGTIRRQLFGKQGTRESLISLLPGLSFMLVLAGIAWLFVLPMQDQSRRTYISENALLPGQALTYFHGSEENIVRAFKEEVRMLSDAPGEERAQVIRQWISGIGYKSATHNWSISHYDDVKAGLNVYGVLHAPRGDTTESMILCAPWLNQDGELNESGVAIAIALARYFTRWSIWSKDIILLIPSDSSFGLSKWVEDYHYTSMPISSGSIQGGIVLDFPGQGGRFEKLEVLYSGLNGQLPNLDLINTVVLICGHMGIKVIVHDIDASDDNYEHRAKTLVTGIAHQALSGIYRSGAGSEAFSGWRIDSVTLAAKTSRDGYGLYDHMLYGRLIEASMRSINNLLEHFHQSYFFYLLLSPYRFVSIATYLPSAMMIGASFTIKGIYYWMSSTSTKSGRMFDQAISAFGLFTAIVFFSVALFSLSSWTPSSMLATTASVISTVTAMFPIIFRLFISPQPLSYINKLQSYVLVFVGLFLTTLSTLNFSLSLMLGLIFAPLAHALTPNVNSPTNKLMERLKCYLAKSISWIAIVATCPWLDIYLYYALVVKELVFPRQCSLQAFRNFLANTSHEEFGEFLSGIMWSWRALGVWSFVPILFVVWLPLWLVACVVVSVRAVAETDRPTPEERTVTVIENNKVHEDKPR